MKREVYPKAFRWFAEVRAAEEHGSRAALAFAHVARVDARKNCLEAGFPKRDRPPSVVAGDSMFEEWIFEETFDVLLGQYIKGAVEFGEPECLDALIPVLEKAIKKAKAAKKKMGV